MIKLNLYKYDSTKENDGYRGTDYSSYILQGVENKEDITQELDTSAITLAGLDIAKEFDPETKFIIDVIQEIDGIEQKTTLHRVVSRDTVRQKILSDNTYFDHHISFIEPSVIAQKRLVDNISATYKLKDVTLETKTAYPQTDLTYYMKNGEFAPTRNFGVQESGIFAGTKYSFYNGKYFVADGDFRVITPLGVEKDQKYLEIDDFDDNGQMLASFKVPKLKIMCGKDNDNTFQYIGDASIDYTIQEFNPTDDYNPTNTWTGSFISNSNLGTSTHWENATIGQYDYIYDNSWILEEIGVSQFALGVYRPDYYYKKYTDPLELNAPTYITQQIPIKQDMKYKVTISLHQFDDDLNIGDNESLYRIRKFNGENISKYINLDLDSQWIVIRILNVYPSREVFTNDMTTTSAEVLFYHEKMLDIIYASAIPYSAYALLQKAIINSSIYEKKDGIYIADVNSGDFPFLIDETYVDKLKATTVIENFYNQKNLWEVMVEIGNYIHAIPELKFGVDDKFVITFNELGKTDESDKQATNISIFNSRDIEDYISATSSYISNMVQLGGTIEEWVSPKTNSEQMLVYNETAEIQTSKPIIELLEIKVMANENMTLGGRTITAGEIKDMTDFVFEENIYKTLGLDWNLLPNRGVALYYKLGTNSIVGGDFRLPQVNDNMQTDYAIKKVIYSAFLGYSAATSSGSDVYWTNLKVNSFSFFIKYRTKDSVRQNHARPDLRKYLIGSKYDRYPEHNQFNNQQDVLVDSIKFGNNIYGKLLKTGNSEYTITEWNDKITNIKHKGELYRINGDLYYVAKVTHIYYSTYIASEITYSKDYNELSSVIGIPSEPRFYEISEQSQIRREIAINDMLVLTNEGEEYISQNIGDDPSFVNNVFHIRNLIFGTGDGSFAKYALTIFKGDKDSYKYDQTVGDAELYKEIFTPINAYSSENTLTYEWDMVDNYGAGDKIIDVQTPAQAEHDSYKSLMAVPYTDKYGRSTLMDFFILGDIPQLTPQEIQNLPESPITTIGRYLGVMQVNHLPTSLELDDFVYEQTGSYSPLGYMIKVELTQNSVTTYYLYINDGSWTFKEISDTYTPVNKNFLWDYVPSNKIYATNVHDFDTNYNGRGIGLLKDCREAISINYNLQLLTSTDQFVLSPFLFLPNKTRVYIVLLDKEVNKLSNGYIDNSSIITAKDLANRDITIEIQDGGTTKTVPYFTWDLIPGLISYGVGFRLALDLILASVNPHHFDGTDGYTQVKSIALICNASLNPSDENDKSNLITGKTQFVMARNIPIGTTKEDAIKRWFIGVPKKNNLFNKKQ